MISLMMNSFDCIIIDGLPRAIIIIYENNLTVSNRIIHNYNIIL